MKSLTESLITEARQVKYQVVFLSTADDMGLPYTATILIDKENQKDFETFLAKEEGNIFGHAEGGNIEY